MSQTNSSKGNEPYPSFETGDPQMDKVLDQIAAACLALEESSLKLEEKRKVMEVELAKSTKDRAKLEAIKVEVQGIVSKVVELENITLPNLLREFQGLSQGKDFDSAVLDNLKQRLSAVSRTGALDIGAEPVPQSQEQEQSPWEVD